MSLLCRPLHIPAAKPSGEARVDVFKEQVLLLSLDQDSETVAIIHECCHQYEHDLFVWGQSLYRADIVGIDCPVVREQFQLSGGRSPVFWAERQARQMTYRAKMNKMVARTKAEEYLRFYRKRHPKENESTQEPAQAASETEKF